MKHSVILANYNGMPYLPQAIESVLRQTDRELELILVDDCSRDASAKVMDDFASRHSASVRVIRHSVNSGQSAGMNTGFAASSGEIISFIDSDDYWFDNKLAHVRRRLETSPHAALYAHNLNVLRDDVVTDELAIDGLTIGNLVAHWQKNDAFPMFSPTSALSFRREVLQQVFPIPEELRISSDGYLTRTSICFGSVIADMECFGVYRIHHSNNVAENPTHDSWQAFLSDTRPLLRRFYQQRNIDLPLHLLDSVQPISDDAGNHTQPPSDLGGGLRRTASRLLDVSPRKILRKFGLHG